MLKGINRLAAGRFGDVKTAGDGVLEMRFFFGPGYRVYYTVRGTEIILLLCGGDKSTQAKDIAAAQAIAEEYRS